MGKFIDLTGKQFGRWTVLEYCGNYKWKCQCNCPQHTIRIVSGQNLRRGRSTSCGCYNREIASKNLSKIARKPNYYIIVGEEAHFYTNKGQEFIVDAEDVEKVYKFSWYISDSGYVVTKDKDNHHLTLGRYILNLSAKDKIDIDHINRNKTDNRKSNLRICNRSQNNYNRQCKNSVGYKGVKRSQNGKRFIAQANSKYLGTYDTPEEAHDVWKKYADSMDYNEYILDKVKGAS